MAMQVLQGGMRARIIDWQRLSIPLFLFYSFFFILLTPAIHEYGHSIAIELCGDEKYEVYLNIFDMHSYITYNFDKCSLWEIFFIASFGGIFSSIVYLVLFFVVKHQEAKLILLVLSVLHFVYGIVEGIEVVMRYL